MPTASGLVPAPPDRLRVRFSGTYSEEGNDVAIYGNVKFERHKKLAEQVAAILKEDDIRPTSKNDNTMYRCIL